MEFFKKNISVNHPCQSTDLPGKNFTLRGWAASDIGLVRANNEDNYVLDIHMNANAAKCSQAQTAPGAIDSGWHLFGIFDGMGGGEKGEIAAEVSAKRFRDTCAQMQDCATQAEIDSALRKAFLDSNNEIVCLQRKFKIYGTTGTVLCTNGIVFKIYHLGDSRAYLLRDGHLFQLTKDQTLAQMKIDVGLYDENAPQAEIERHKLTEYIGRDWTKENLCPVESQWIPFRSEDRILLCSDGLYDMCADEEILKTISHSSDENAPAALIENALANGGIDNVTCILLTFLKNPD